jgi:hypothetical protein
MGRIGQIYTDFFFVFIRILSMGLKKIRSDPPDPPHPFSHRITISKYKRNRNVLPPCFDLFKSIHISL